MSETVYYSSGKVQVTSSRFLVGNQIFPIGQITSVKLALIPVKAGCAVWAMLGGGMLVVMALIAAINAAAAGNSMSGPLGFAVFGVVVGFLGWLMRKQAKQSYEVQITTAAGEQKLLRSTEREMPAAVVAALNQAIADREAH